jgi:hypothetical protein
MTKCTSCGAYGNSDHSASCVTKTGVRIVRPVQPVYEWESNKNRAKTNGTFTWLWEG